MSMLERIYFLLRNGVLMEGFVGIAKLIGAIRYKVKYKRSVVIWGKWNVYYISLYSLSLILLYFNSTEFLYTFIDFWWSGA